MGLVYSAILYNLKWIHMVSKAQVIVTSYFFMAAKQLHNKAEGRVHSQEELGAGTVPNALGFPFYP